MPLIILSQEKVIEDTTYVQREVLSDGDIIQKTIDMILSQSISPSPNASTFSKVGDLNVNEYSGAFSTNIPLFNLQSHGVELPISISYQTNGIKVNDIPGNVGLGWSLNAGGVINRTIKGICDEMDYAIQTEDGGILMVGYQQLDFCGHYADKGGDCLPDEFTINVPGHLSGNFYFKRNRDIMEDNYNGYLINEERYITSGTYLDFVSGFDIIDRNGNQFNFDDVEKLKTYSTQEMGVIYSSDNHNSFTSSFFLSNIVTNSDITAYTFEYTDYSGLTYNDLPIKNYFNDHTLPGGCSTCTDHLYGSPPQPETVTVFSNREMLSGKRLSRILFQDGYLEFNYNLDRQDIPGDLALTSIELYSLDNVLVKGYVFNYDYFISNGSSVLKYNKRLKLISIQEYGNDLHEIPPYLFSYNEIPLAPRNSYRYDSWGYNNGTNSDASLSSMYHYPSLSNLLSPFKLNEFSGEEIILSNPYSQFKNPNNNANAGVLEIIKYPTGGVHTIDYELNEFVFNNATYTGGGLRVRQFSTHTYGALEKIIKYKYTLEDSDNSSGSISLIPQYGYSCNGINNDGLVFSSNDNNSPAYMHEPVIGYSCVKKEIFNADEDQFNGTAITLFHSISDIPNEEVIYSIDEEMFVCSSYNWNLENITTNDYPFFNDFSNEVKRGNISKKKYIDNNGILLKEDSYSYTYQTFDQINIAQSRYFFYANNPQCNDYYAFIGEYNLKSSKNLIESVTTNDIFGSGFVQNVTTKTYDNMANISSILNVTGNDEIKLEYKYIYDFDYLSHSIVVNPTIKGFYILSYQNRISSPIETVKKVKNETEWRVVGAELNIPVAINSNIATIDQINYLNLDIPKSESQFEFASIASDASLTYDPAYETTIIFDDYDPITGQIREFHKNYDIHYVILWGYNKLYPVAKIVNSSYRNVESAMSQAGVSYDDLQLLTAPHLLKFFKKLREIDEMKNSQITSYNYQPLYGISSITDSRSVTSYFEYDNHGRLILVKDMDQNINQYVEYHYKTQNNCYNDKLTCLQEAYDNYIIRDIECLKLVHNQQAYLECVNNNKYLYEHDIQNCETSFQECMMTNK